MTDPLIGTQLDEYLLEDLLGHGGMARVYRGLDTGLERYAAVKVIDTPYQQDEDYIARFEKEARAIAQLDHPHIVTVYRYGGSGQLFYLAMKYVKGADLNTVLNGYEDDKQFMPDGEVTRLVREIGSALDYAHSQGVIHRDIKPSNIMLDLQGHSYLTDFGLALLTEVGTQGEILGSPQYIAPEQAISSAGAVAQSDLYALGVILYRMVTGTIPFDDEDMLELLMMHMTVPPPSPRTIRPEISPAMEDMLLKALAKEPSNRYQSGTALADAYVAALANATAVSLATAPTLTIMDRVALDMEFLPSPVYEEPQLATEPISPIEPTSAVSEEEFGGRKVWPIAVGVGLLLLLCFAFFLLRGRFVDDEALAVVDVQTTVPPTIESELVFGEADAVQLNPTALSAAWTTYIPVIVSESEPQVPSNVVPTATLSSPATEIIQATDTLYPTKTPVRATEPPASVVYQLLIVMNKEDSLFVVNQAGGDFPLSLLRLGSDDGAIQGTEWEIALLAQGNCVTAWKDGGKSKPPDIECNQVGERVERKKSDRFWKDEFVVFYDGEQVGVCKPKKPCLVEIAE